MAENYLFNPYGKTKAAKRRIRLTATAKTILASRVAELDGEMRLKNTNPGTVVEIVLPIKLADGDGRTHK